MADPALFVPSKPSFLTQSGALLRKNIRYQKKNWCAACVAAGHLGWRGEGTLARLRLLTRSAPPALSPRRKTNCCLVLTPLVFSVVLGGACAAQPRGALAPSL